MTDVAAIDAALGRLVTRRERIRHLLSSAVPESLRGVRETVTAICAALDRDIEQLFEQREQADELLAARTTG